MNTIPATLRVGLPADDVLKTPGYSRLDALSRPTLTGQDDHGLLATWHYAECDIDFHYRDGCYRIAAIHPKGATG
jgi:hypothetical protein